MNLEILDTCRAFAEVDSAALRENFRSFAATHTARSIAVVKANAYGHDVNIAVPAFLEAGCDFFAVATLKEALEVRALAKDADILLLGFAPPAAAELLAKHRIIQTVFSLDFAKALGSAAKAAGVTVRVHIKVNGGMCRLGFLTEEREQILATLELENLDICGIFTHFPKADTNPELTERSLREFCALRNSLPVKLFAHASASAAAMSMPDGELDGVRPGILLYGYPPISTALPLRPALRLTVPVAQIHEVASGTPVGYGGEFVTARPSRIGTLPCGYADGFTRDLKGMDVTLLHNGKRYTVPLCGRICMDYCMVDLTDTPAVPGDLIYLIEDADKAASRRGTIPYEVLTGISYRVPRIKGELLS